VSSARYRIVSYRVIEGLVVVVVVGWGWVCDGIDVWVAYSRSIPSIPIVLRWIVFCVMGIVLYSTPQRGN
jgi:uncharacterized membrane protein HdeD (DUF308 family)